MQEILATWSTDIFSARNYSTARTEMYLFFDCLPRLARAGQGPDPAQLTCVVNTYFLLSPPQRLLLINDSARENDALNGSVEFPARITLSLYPASARFIPSVQSMRDCRRPLRRRDCFLHESKSDDQMTILSPIYICFVRQAP